MSLPTTAGDAPPCTGRVPGNKGIWVGICCEFVEFLVLFIVYFVARAHFPDAFHTGAERLSQTAGVVITLLMVSSSFFIACSVTRLRTGRRRESIAWLIALSLAIAFMGDGVGVFLAALTLGIHLFTLLFIL